MEASDGTKNDKGIRCEWQPKIYWLEIENKWNRIEGFVVFQFEKDRRYSEGKTTYIKKKKSRYKK